MIGVLRKTWSKNGGGGEGIEREHFVLAQDPTVFDVFSIPTMMRGEDDQPVSWLRKAAKLVSVIFNWLGILS